MVDDALILRKIANLDEYLPQIQEYKNVSLQAYKKDWKVQRIIERTLQMMIETCMDIAGHIISDQKLRVPKNYSDAFAVLFENGILDAKLCDTMQKMTKFRNIVIHDYEKIDAEIVIGILRKNLDDFVSYKKSIIEHLKRQKESKPA